MTDSDDRRRSFGLFARDAARGGSPLYAALAAAVGDEPVVRDIVAARRPGQPAPNMIFAATHFLILRGADHPLKEYFATAGGERSPDAALTEAFLDFCRERRADLTALVARRATNTNEAGRSALIAAGLSHLARRRRRPLFLVELGPSAGLNLNFDRYAYRFLAEDGRERAAFWTPAKLRIDCVARNEKFPDLGAAPPEIARRLGIERDPVDIGDADDRDWLRALIWPERAERMARLETALAIARAFPPPIRKGDAVGDLAAVLAEAPADCTPCVFHTAVTYQFTDEARSALDDVFIETSRTRPCWRLALEWRDGDIYPLTLTCYDAGAADETMLARSDPHGRWIDWRG